MFWRKTPDSECDDPGKGAPRLFHAKVPGLGAPRKTKDLTLKITLATLGMVCFNTFSPSPDTKRLDHA